MILKDGKVAEKKGVIRDLSVTKMVSKMDEISPLGGLGGSDVVPRSNYVCATVARGYHPKESKVETTFFKIKLPVW